MPVNEVKKQFSKLFPFLKLELFLHDENKRYSQLQKVDDGCNLSEISTLLQEGIFSFDPSSTIVAFKQQLLNEQGLLVGVFSKSGHQWVETTDTDYLSLNGQNAISSASNRPFSYNIHTLFL